MYTHLSSMMDVKDVTLRLVSLSGVVLLLRLFKHVRFSRRLRHAR